MNASCSFAIIVGFLLFAGNVQTTVADLTADEQQELLDLHNQDRKNVDPPATNMITMNWHDGLASAAQSWADGCQFEHNHPSVPEFEYVGQNLAMGMRSLEDLINMWYDECKNYNYETNTCEGVCGHYTQMVWAQTDYVGCGLANCDMDIDGQTWPMKYLVCNYAPGGNMMYQDVVQKPYED